MSAAQDLATTMAAARQANSFHFVDKDGSGAQAELLVGDAGHTTAQQTLTVGSSVLDVRLIDELVYLRAGTTTLQNVLGLSTTKASTEAGRWISMASPEKGYGQIVKSLRPSSELDSYIPQAPLSLGSTTRLHGATVVPVTGVAPADAANGDVDTSATLFVSTRAPYLPVGGTITGTDVHGRRQSDQVAFTRWGERIKPTVPTGVVTDASLMSGGEK